MKLSDLNLKEQTEKPYCMEYINEHGQPTGLFLLVIGDQSPSVQAWRNKQWNAERVHNHMNEKRGVKKDVTLIEEDIDFGTEYVSRRIVGWKGLDDPWSPEGAFRLCQINPLIMEQVKAASENIGNFTKSKASSSLNSPDTSTTLTSDSQATAKV